MCTLILKLYELIDVYPSLIFIYIFILIWSISDIIVLSDKMFKIELNDFDLYHPFIVIGLMFTTFIFWMFPIILYYVFVRIRYYKMNKRKN